MHTTSRNSLLCHFSHANSQVPRNSIMLSPVRCDCRARGSSSSSSNTPSGAAGQGSVLPPTEVYQNLPASFWNERRILYNRMRHERDRANRRARLKELREVEAAQLAQQSPEVRASYELEMTALRIAAAKQQKQALADALQHGLQVVIDCSYCMLPSSRSSRGSPGNAGNQQQQQQQVASTQQASNAGLGALAAATAEIPFKNVAPLQPAYKPQNPASIATSTSRGGSSSSRGGSSSSSQEPVTSWQRGADRSSHEVRSLAKQIELAVSFNRRSSQPVSLTVTSFTGALEMFALHMGAHSWPLNKHAHHVLGVLPAEHIVLLSPDVDTPLLELNPNKAYVIGGIVDRSVCKGLTAGFGVQHGLEVVRLPVLEYAEQLGLNFPGAKKRPILNISDVVVALIEFNRTGDWVHGLEQAIPARKRRV